VKRGREGRRDWEVPHHSSSYDGARTSSRGGGVAAHRCSRELGATVELEGTAALPRSGGAEHGSGEGARQGSGVAFIG
jgi:hypothetical protein